MKRKIPLLIALAVLLAIAFGATAILPFAFRSNPSVASPAQNVSEDSMATAYTPEEIFRRAFWRHPSNDDQIVHAERLEMGGSGRDVESWQWFLQVEPGPELLAALRDPATFGLTLTTAPRFPGDRASAPAWFQPPANSETLQNPSGGLLIFYNKTQNTLFATDAGAGFAPPVTSSQTRF